jgi:hypothetical protein
VNREEKEAFVELLCPAEVHVGAGGARKAGRKIDSMIATVPVIVAPASVPSSPAEFTEIDEWRW